MIHLSHPWWPKRASAAACGGAATAAKSETTPTNCCCLSKLIRRLMKRRKTLQRASRQSSSSVQCRYDPLSYALNFDRSSSGDLEDEDYYKFYAFSSRFVVANRRTDCERFAEASHS